MSSSSFYVSLPSTTSDKFFDDNKAGQYTTMLPQAINLNGEYEVGLSEILYSGNFINIGKDECWLDFNLRAIFQAHITIEPGLYTDNEEFINMITKKLKDIKKLTGIKFIYNKSVQKVSIRQGAIGVLTLSSKLARLLGFKNRRLLGVKMYIADSIMDLIEDYHNTFVYSDIVSQTTVGDTYAPLLRIIPTTNTKEKVIHHIFQTPHYKPVSRNYFTTIEILLKNHLGETYSFASGQTIVTLHFRPREN